MSARYALTRVDRSGVEDVVADFGTDPKRALKARDVRVAEDNHLAVLWRVIDLDDPERGDIDWPDE